MEKPVEKLFWGLVVKNGKEYKKTPNFNFHVSMAVLDLKTSDGEAISLHVQVENGEYILCNLTKNQPQVHLDLIFSEGEKIKFYTTGGKGDVHMTGYVMPEDDFADMEDEEFSDEEVSIDSELAEQVAGSNKRKTTETLKLTGKDAKKLKTNDNKAVEKQKIIDVDPKQLLNSNKKQQDNKVEQKKPQAQASQQKKPQPNAKLATKDLEVDSDDDLSVDEDEESVDLNNLNKLVDEESDLDDLNDEDLESDDNDLESDDEEDLAKLKAMKSKVAKPNQQANNKQVAGGQQKKPFEKFNQGKPNQQGNKPQNGQQFNKFQNKSPQHQNKGNPNNSFNKGFQKHQQTPFNKNQHNNSNKKGGTPFQHNNKNKSFGSNNKEGYKGKKVFT